MLNFQTIQLTMKKTLFRFLNLSLLLLFGMLSNPLSALFAQTDDWRNLQNGIIIPDKTYSDQPYILKTDDGAWLCVMTTGLGHEGDQGQHIISQRSLDSGKTWEKMVEIEPSDGPEASYSVLLKAPSGRIFVFYNHNTDNVREIKGDSPPYRDGIVRRVDSQGYFVFKYSDDHGKTWSKDRITLPVREFEIDRNNVYGGAIRFFWNVGKAFAHKGSAFVPLTKVGGFGEGFFTSNEGVLLQSENLFAVEDPRDAVWRTLPDGDIGLRTPAGGGPIAAEHSYSVLSDGSFFVVYRSLDGHPVYSYSRDGGRTWDAPQYMAFANGRLMKNPRAANFAWKVENGKYLYWFHNHGGRFIREHPNPSAIGYNDRNPVWVSGGTEVDTEKGKVIRWSQPEVLLYDDDPMIRISYPDLLEDGGNYYITETQKDIARLHQIDPKFLDILWGQLDNPSNTEQDQTLHWRYEGGGFPQVVPAPSMPTFRSRDPNTFDFRGLNVRSGFTVELSFTLASLEGGQVLLDTRDTSGKGWWIAISERGTLEIQLNDGQTRAVWDSDPGILKTGKEHVASIIVDGGPKIISFVLDAVFNDGGDERQFGWGRFSPYFKTPQGSSELQIGTKLNGQVTHVRVFNRPLLVTEAIANQQHLKKK
ncbi:hypothetical protein ADIS_2769 [Lunatimonas lonarensis]|uniref:Sialidase domain-containing protein n=2 Tax=Lunatimonas lonarensis TaxID=1232681 RepID=R7ZRT5_9BACT|nr:hypothetical protein ADIS_2769 [Lunatimonas lonarensis]